MRNPEQNYIQLGGRLREEWLEPQVSISTPFLPSFYEGRPTGSSRGAVAVVTAALTMVGMAFLLGGQ